MVWLLASGVIRDVYAFGCPEDGVNLLDTLHQLCRGIEIDMLFRRGAELGGLPDDVV